MMPQKIALIFKLLYRGPGKSRTSEIRTSGYYIANFH